MQKGISVISLIFNVIFIVLFFFDVNYVHKSVYRDCIRPRVNSEERCASLSYYMNLPCMTPSCKYFWKPTVWRKKKKERKKKRKEKKKKSEKRKERGWIFPLSDSTSIRAEKRAGPSVRQPGKEVIEEIIATRRPS